MKALDVAMQSGPIAAARPSVRAVRWDGLESPWVHAAWAAAPWPIWCAIAAFVHASSLLGSGVLVLSIVLAAMVVWAHRPAMRASLRWVPSIVGTGLLGELFCVALLRRDATVFSEMEDLPRAIAVWLICVAIYEVAPIVAAGSRITPREHRDRALDLGAHLSFAAMAIAAYAWHTRWGYSGQSWTVSPWMAVALALPLAAVRCGPRRPAELATSEHDVGIWTLTATAWVVLVVVLIALGGLFLDGPRDEHSRGLGAEDRMLLAFPAWSIALSMIAALALIARALRVRRAPHGTVVQVSEDGITIERAMKEEPISVALEMGPMPEIGTTVTLLGMRDRSVEIGPFRDGAPRFVAKRAYPGTPDRLAISLIHRSGRWLALVAGTVLGGLVLHFLLDT